MPAEHRSTGKESGHGQNQPAYGLRGTLGAAAAGALARPYIANAQAKTAVGWINQGFIPQEDAAMRQVCEDYMKASGNKLDYSLMPFMAHESEDRYLR